MTGPELQEAGREADIGGILLPSSLLLIPMPRYTRFALLVLLGLAACAPNGDAALQRGDEALGRLQLGEAVEQYTAAIDADGERAAAYLGRGKTYWTMNQFEESVADLDRALVLDPALPWAHYFRGAGRLQLGQFEGGIADLAEAARTEALPLEDRTRAHYLRAVAHMSLEEYDAGIDALTDGIALRPEHAFYYFERGQLYEATGQTDAAVADFERYLALAGPEAGGGELVEQARRKLAALRADARTDLAAGA